MSEVSDAVQPMWPRWTASVVLACLLVFVGLCVVFPEADTPSWLPGLPVERAHELLVEPAAKAHEARNMALFGEWQRNPSDQYQFWRPQSPVWVYPLAGAFRLFGTNYIVLHVFSSVVGLLGLSAMALLLRRLVAPAPGLLVLAASSTNLFAVLTGRSGLIEVAIGSAAIGLVLFVTLAKRHPAWLLAAQLCFFVGFFAKQGMLYTLPVITLGTLWICLTSDRRSPWRWIPVATGTLLTLLAAIVVLQPDYLRTVWWNIDHLIRGGASDDGSADIAYGTRLDPARLWWSLFVILPVTGVLGWMAVVVVSGRAVLRRTISWEHAVVTGWMLCSWLAVAVLRTWTVRFSSILLLPTLVMAALLVDVAWRTRWSRTVVSAAMAVALFINIALQVHRLTSVKYTVYDAAHSIEASLPSTPQVVVGRYAMPVMLSTHHDVYFVKPGFNMANGTLSELGVTHVLEGRLDVPATELRSLGYTTHLTGVQVEVDGKMLRLKEARAAPTD
ncbi:MAG: hypothetical protein ACI9MC_002449 [Kiritimatiellia bacterium]|jgi:hypothetical protein